MKDKQQSQPTKSHEEKDSSRKPSRPENPRERGTTNDKVEDDMILRR